MLGEKLSRVVEMLNLASSLNPERLKHIRELESQLNVKLPEIMVNWYAQDHQGFPVPWYGEGHQHEIEAILQPGNIIERNERHYLILWTENQGVFFTAMSIASEEDPSIYAIENTPSGFIEFHSYNFEDYICANLADYFIFSPFYRGHNVSFSDIDSLFAESKINIELFYFLYMMSYPHSQRLVSRDQIVLICHSHDPSLNSVWKIQFTDERPARPVGQEVTNALTDVIYGFSSPEQFIAEYGTDWQPVNDWWASNFHSRR